MLLSRLKIFKVILIHHLWKFQGGFIQWKYFSLTESDFYYYCYIDLDFVKFILEVAICLTNNWRGRGKCCFFIYLFFYLIKFLSLSQKKEKKREKILKVINNFFLNFFYWLVFSFLRLVSFYVKMFWIKKKN